MVAGAVLLMLVPAAPAMAKDKESSRTGEDFEWRGPVAAGKMIEIKGINGSIAAEATSGTEVQVEAHKSGHRSDPEEVKIEVIQHADGVTICAVYPTPPGERPNECAPGDGGHMNTKNNDVNVEFTVRVPNGVRFTGRTVNGSIKARGLRADAEARTVNGSVDISTRGIASASTVNGSIDAEMGTNPKEALEFETVNGGITLVLPASAGAEIRASTVNGAIESDLPITSIGKISHRKLQGTIGKGGPRLKMSTVNGDIRLRTSS
jgi:DUF4097 and DUF4098 domain-containing protein YvlB